MSFFMDRSKDQTDQVPGTTGLDPAIILGPPPIDLDRAAEKAGFGTSDGYHMYRDRCARARYGW
jgi:hypothetical protein